MYSLLKIISCFILLNAAQIESYPCSCSCCLGQNCKPTLLSSSIDAPQCTAASCLEACRERYYQCNISPPHGFASGTCLATTTTTTTQAPLNPGKYSCSCYCCNTGTYQCSPQLIGNTNSFTCDESGCSIACTKQYPNVCINNQYGRTHGNCSGINTSTAPIPLGSKRCGCSCCTFDNTNHYYEVITQNGCGLCLNSCLSIQLKCSNHINTYCIE